MAQGAATIQPLRVIAFDGGWNLPVRVGIGQGFFAANGVGVDLAFTPDSGAIVAGELDRLTPASEARRLAAEVAGPCELLVVPGGTHVANNRAYAYRPQTADWLAARLQAVH
jgi:pimeloyl-ACP methyl ester carboxylesterase